MWPGLSLTHLTLPSALQASPMEAQRQGKRGVRFGIDAWTVALRLDGLCACLLIPYVRRPRWSRLQREATHIAAGNAVSTTHRRF